MQLYVRYDTGEVDDFNLASGIDSNLLFETECQWVLRYEDALESMRAFILKEFDFEIRRKTEDKEWHFSHWFDAMYCDERRKPPEETSGAVDDQTETHTRTDNINDVIKEDNDVFDLREDYTGKSFDEISSLREIT
eukprot:UN13536